MGGNQSPELRSLADIPDVIPTLYFALWYYLNSIRHVFETNSISFFINFSRRYRALFIYTYSFMYYEFGQIRAYNLVTYEVPGGGTSLSQLS